MIRHFFYMKKKLKEFLNSNKKIVVLIAAVILIAVFVFARYRSSQWRNDNTVFLNDSLYGFRHKITTYLLIGTDQSGDERSRGEDYRGNLSDFLLLLVIDHTEKSYGFLQIDRNTIVEVPLIDRKGNLVDYAEEQICTAHWYGGNPEQSAINTANTVKHYLGDLEHLDGYYVLNMEQIALLNQYVGGIRLRIDEDLTPVNPAFEKGAELTLTDDQAIQFVQARYTLADYKNTSRMNRHKTFMHAFTNQAFEKIKEKPLSLINLWDSLKDTTVTDASLLDLYHITRALKRYDDKGIYTINGETILGTILGDGKEHEEFYPNQKSLTDTMKELFSLELIE